MTQTVAKNQKIPDGNAASTLYYDARHIGFSLSPEEIDEIKNVTRILEASGISSEATKWVHENY